MGASREVERKVARGREEWGRAARRSKEVVVRVWEIRVWQILRRREG